MRTYVSMQAVRTLTMTKKVGGLQSCAHIANLYGSQCKEMSVSKTRHTHTHTKGK